MGLKNTTVEGLLRGELGATRERHTFVVERNHADVIEVDDLQFHAGSSIASPAPVARAKDRANETISTLSALAQLLEEHGGRPLWIAGHAGDGKSALFNQALATKRAQNVLALVQGDADAFATSCLQLDYKPLQSMLAWAARVHAIDCDPGPITGENNAATRAALLSFRAAHAQRFGTTFQPLLAPALDDWRAFFTLYERSLADLLEIEPDALSGKRSALVLHEPSSSAAGANNSAPTGPRARELRSSSQRRVDLVLFDPAVAIPPVAQTGEAAYESELRALLTYLPPKRPPGAVCVRLTGMHFDTNKCFLLPGATAGLGQLVALYQEYPQGELLIVGHTDTAGRPEYNDTLSLERAQAVAAYLKDDVDAWLPWYGNDKPKAKRWGSAEDRAMLSALPDGATHLAATHTIKSYQASRGLKDDGIAGPNTRRQLIADYMALDGTTLPAELTPVAHGCGESFPLVQTADNVAQDENRRVELYLFANGIDPAPSGEISKPGSPEYDRWRKRLVREEIYAPDGDRALRIIVEIPCRAGTDFVDDARYRLTFGEQVLEGRTDARGMISVPRPAETEGLLEVWVDDDDELPTEWDVVIGDLPEASDREGARIRLANLGLHYEEGGNSDGAAAEDEALLAFQQWNGVNDPDPFGEPTQRALKQTFGVA